MTRWFANFQDRHGATSYGVVAGALTATADDGSTAQARLPFDRAFTGPADPQTLADAVLLPQAWGILLARKGGFAVARLRGDAVLEHKIGQRHVQGRTKAGGQSQQRFARRRDNQARAAYEATADHAARILVDPVEALVVGGDRSAVEAVLHDARLGHLRERLTTRWLPVPDPRRAVLDQAVADACAVAIDVRNG